MSSKRRYPKSDSQKGKLYDAERRTFTGPGEWDKELPEAEVRRRVDQTINFLVKKFGDAVAMNVTCEFPHQGRGGARAFRQPVIWFNDSGTRFMGPHVRFTPGSRNRWVILHECAHMLDPHRHPEYDGDSRAHGWVFADVYLTAVQHFLGVEAAKTLRAEFREGKVRYRPKRKPNPSATPPTPPTRTKAATVFVATPLPRNSVLGNPVDVEGLFYSTRNSVFTRGPHVAATSTVTYHGGTRTDGRAKVLWRVSEAALRRAVHDVHWLNDSQYNVVAVPRSTVEPEAS